MHVAVFGIAATLLGTALAYGLSCLVVGTLHLFGYRESYYYGIWTVPNALFLDITLVTFAVSAIVWPLIGSLFIFCLKWPLQRSWWTIEPFEAKSQTWIQFGKNMSSILLHSPIISFVVEKNKIHFSMRAFHLMLSRILLIALATITFCVMPCCTVVTVRREQLLRERADHFRSLNRDPPIPFTCGEMFPEASKFWSEKDAKYFEGNEVIFESLCWKFNEIFQFGSFFGMFYGFILSLLCVLTVSIQYAQKRS